MNMQIHNVISITEARKKLPQIVREVYALDGTSYILTDKGEARAVIISHEEYESLIATIEVLSIPNILQDIAEAEEDIKEGRVVSDAEFRKMFGQ